MARTSEQLLGGFNQTSERQRLGVQGAFRISGTQQAFTAGSGGRLITSATDLLSQGFREDEVLEVSAEEAKSIGFTGATPQQEFGGGVQEEATTQDVVSGLSQDIPTQIGDVVYISGYSIGQQRALVAFADSSSSATMPAIAILADATLANNASGHFIESGNIVGIDTSSWTTGDELYVSETGTTGNTLTSTRPSGTASVQKVAVVLRSHASLGVIEVFGAGRTNDLMNIANTKVWIGDASGVPQEFALSGGATMTAGGAVTVVTNANLTGVVTSSGNATAIADKALAISKLADGTDGELITWSAAGVIAAVAVGTAGQVLTSGGVGVAPTFQAGGVGDALVANPLSQFAATTSLQLKNTISDETGSGLLVFGTSPTLITPALGTPASGVMTNVSGTAASLTAGTVTTNANLTGVVTSTGNATAIAAKALAISKIADGTDGELITWGTTGVIETVAAGTSAQVLTSNGAGAAPTFQAAGGGGGQWTLVSKGTFTADDTELSGSLDGDTDIMYKVVVICRDGSTDMTPKITFNNDGGSNYDYSAQTGGFESSDLDNTTGGESTTGISFGSGGEDRYFILEFIIWADSIGPRVVMTRKAGTISTSKHYSRTGVGVWNNSADNLTSIEFFTGTTIDSGKFWIYKITDVQ